MPYVIVESHKKSKNGKIKHGYRVRKRDKDKKTGKYVYFSREPLTFKMAVKQRKAIILSELRRKGRI